MKIQHVPIEWVNQTWTAAAPFIEEAVAYSHGEYTLDQVRLMVTSGQWLLIVAVEDGVVQGAAAINLFNRPDARVAFVMALGGKFVINADTFDQLKQLMAVGFGATAIEGAVRESVARLWARFGFKEKYRVGGVKLWAADSQVHHQTKQ